MFPFCPVITGLFIVKTGLYPLLGKITENDDSSDRNLGFSIKSLYRPLKPSGFLVLSSHNAS